MRVNREDLMIQLWTWPTPNGQKIHIALEELELPYEIVPIDIRAGAQFRPEFLAITAGNHRIPAIVDTDAPGGSLSLFESGAILIYLAEKTGKLLPKDPAKRAVTLQWLMFQMASVGPMFGQHGHFALYASEKIPYAIERYTNEALRILGVLDKRLAESAWLAGDEYTIADIATFPWTRTSEGRSIDMSAFPNVSRWHAAMQARPGVQRGLDVMKEQQRRQPTVTDEEREVLFGKKQFEKR
jgi:GST-like protein